MTREEAAAEYATRRAAVAYAIRDTLATRNGWDMADAALTAADAHDAAHGIHRVSLDDATVERAARALLDAFYDDKTLKVDDEDRDIVRAVLAAAVEAGQ